MSSRAEADEELDFVGGLSMPPQEAKAVEAMAARCKGDADCLSRQIDASSKEARAHLRETIRSLSPDLELVLGQACPQQGSSARAFLETNLCQQRWIDAVNEGSRKLLDPSTLSREHFDRFLQDARAEKPQPWYVAVYARACAPGALGSKPGYECFAGRLLQLSRDSKAASDSMSKYLGRMFRGMVLTRKLCAAGARGAKSCRDKTPQDYRIAVDDPGRPSYRPVTEKDAAIAGGPKAGGSPSEGGGPAPRGEGVKGGKDRACGTGPDGKPLDCRLQSLVAPADAGWEVEGPVASCPEFLKPYNCMAMGSGQAGDLSNIRNAPYFFAARERMCRRRVKARVSADEHARLARAWGRPEKASAESSPACAHLIDELKQPDPVPPLSREQIDTARVSGNGQLHDTLMSLADIASESGLQRDLGAYSAQQQAVGLLQVKANLDPRILTDSDPAAFNAAAAELLGAASCLAEGEKTDLKTQLEALRAAALERAGELKERRAELDSMWVEGLTARAKEAVQAAGLDKGLGKVWESLDCGSTGVSSHAARARRCLKEGAGGSEGYRARQRLFAELGVATYAGNPGAGEDAACQYMSCEDVGLATKAARARFESVMSANPLLGETPKTRGVQCDPTDPACAQASTLAYQLAFNESEGSRLAAARAAAERLHGDGVKALRAICGKASGLAEEGAHAAGVQQLSQGFMSCADVGEYSPRCQDRRSFGWAMCRLHMKNVADANTRKARDTFVGMAMAAGFGLSALATMGGSAVGAGVLGLGMTGSGAYLRHQERHHASDEYRRQRADFRNRWGSYEKMRGSWERMQDAERNAVAADIFDALTSAVDVGALAHALRTARAAGKAAAVDELLKQGKGVEAFAAARKMRGAEEELAAASALRRSEGFDPREELLDAMRSQVRPYGPRAQALKEPELLRLSDLDRRVQALLDEGLIDLEAAGRIRRQIADSLVSTEKLKALGQPELRQLYHEMQARGRFSGAGGARVRDRFLAIFEGLLREKHPEISDGSWKLLAREDKLAMAEEAFSAEQIEKAARARAQTTGSIPPSSTSSAYRKVAREITAAEVRGSPEVHRLRERHRVFDGVSKADNAAYLDKAYDAGGATRDGRSLYFEHENAILKQLNDYDIGDKDLVTALENLDKEILLGNLIESPLLRSRLDAQYSDFKSLRFKFRDNSPELRKELERVYEKSAAEFAAALERSPVKRLYEGSRGLAKAPESWHLAGIGSTADEASAAARHARTQFREGRALTPMQDFTQVAHRLDDRLDAVERLRASLAEELGFVPELMARTPGGKLVLSEAAVDVLRKVKASSYEEYVAEAQAQFRKFGGIELSEEQVLDLRDYAALSDGFSASIVSKERVVIDLAEADAGVVSIDFGGQGARNIQATMAELADSAGQGSREAVMAARRSERQATRRMAGMNDAVRDATAGIWGADAPQKLRFSGDDGVFMPREPLTRAQKREFVGRLAHQDNAGSYRVTFLPREYAGPAGAAGIPIPAAERSQLIVKAETFEKDLRKALGVDLPVARLKGLGLGVDLAPRREGGGGVNLLLGGDVDPATLKLIRDRAAQKLPDGYRLGEVEVVARVEARAKAEAAAVASKPERRDAIPPPPNGKTAAPEVGSGMAGAKPPAQAVENPLALKAAPLAAPPAVAPVILNLARGSMRSASRHLLRSEPLSRARTRSWLQLGMENKAFAALDPRTREALGSYESSAAKLAANSPDPGKAIAEIRVVRPGGAVSRDTLPELRFADRGTGYWLPIEGDATLRIRLKDGTELDWKAGAQPPEGFRWDVPADSQFAASGFSGGHTREAWDELMRSYGPLVEIHDVQRSSFRIPGVQHDIQVTRLSYDYRSEPGGAPVAVQAPKTLFDGERSAADLKAFERYASPWIADAAARADVSQPTLDVRVPVTDPKTGAAKSVKVRVGREGATAKDPVGRIVTWYVEAR